VAELIRIDKEQFDAAHYALPIAAQDLRLGAPVSFDDETEDGLPLVWLTSRRHAAVRPVHDLAERTKAGEPAIVYANGISGFGFNSGDIWVVSKEQS
jgi:hypothetical protein